MIRVKDLKNEFMVIKSGVLDGAYNLYSNTRSGKRTNKLYLGYVTIKNGKVIHYPSNSTTNDITELITIANDWADNAEYEVSTYSPDCRARYVAEIRIHDFMKSLGFEFTHGNTYTKSLSNTAGNKDIISFFIEVEDTSDTTYKVNVQMNLGGTSWIDLSADTYKDAISNVSAMIRVTAINTMANALDLFNNVPNANLEDLDNIMMKKITNSLDVVSTSYKDYIISVLEETLNKLKN